jgi:MoxR-like ATPase
MHVSDIFPFLSLLPVQKNYALPQISLERVLLFPGVYPLPKEVLDMYAPVCNVYYFRNINVYVLNTQCLGELVSTYRELIDPRSPGKPSWVINEVNPEFLDIEESSDGVYFLKKVGGSYRVRIDEHLDYFKVLIGEKDPKDFLLPSNVDIKMFEAPPVIKEGLFDGKDKFDIEKAEEETKYGTFDDLKSFLQSDPTPRPFKSVPLLQGHTGVSKSAIIKSIVESTSTTYGLRLVDLRVSFMDKLDVEGIMELTETKEGERFSMAPMKELVLASDQFLSTVRGFLNDPSNMDKLKKDPENHAKLIELSKTPVLVFEEVNRCPTSIRQLLTSLLNTKEFLDYTLYEAKVVATANVPVGSNSDTVKQFSDSFYDADGFRDLAYKKRFIPIDVDPTANTPSGKSVRSSWMNWAYGPPSPRSLVIIKDSYATSSVYDKLKIPRDPSNAGSLAVVSRPITTNEFENEGDIQFSVYLCGDVTESFLSTLSNTKTLQEFIKNTFSANKQVVVCKQDLQEYDPLTNKVKVDKRGREKSLDSSNLHPMVLKYLKTSEGLEDAYNMDSVVKAMNEGEDVRTYRLLPVTSFRSWEFVSNILKARDTRGTKEFYPSAFDGMLDDGTSNRFSSFLRKNKWVSINSDNKMTDLLEEGINSDVPVMLRGPSSIGKTARVNAIAEKNNMELINIVLSAKDRTSVKGLPMPSDAVEGIFTPGEVEKSSLLQSFGQYYKGNVFSIGEMATVTSERAKGNAFKILSIQSDSQYEVQEYNVTERGKENEPIGGPKIVRSTDLFVDRNLPSSVSYNATFSNMVAQLERAKALNKPVLFFVDEINRVSSPVIMSCILEAISDKRVMGVDFSGVKVSVVAACNVGEAHRDALTLDPALVARFLNVAKPEADKQDFDSYMDYAKKSVKKGKLHPLIVSTIEKLGNSDDARYSVFKSLFFEPETEGTQEDKVFSSTRALGALSNHLFGNGLIEPIKGKRIATDKRSFIERLNKCKDAKSLFTGWIGENYNQPFEFTSDDGKLKSITCGQVMKDIQDDYYNNLSNMGDVQKEKIQSLMYAYMSRIEQHFVGVRAEIVKTWLGVDPSKTAAMRSFMEAFNVAADGSIEWDDLVNSGLVSEYFKLSYGGANQGASSIKSDFSGLFKKAIAQFSGYGAMDYAKWFIALNEYLESIKGASYLDEIVSDVISDKEISELLRTTIDASANKMLEDSLK